MSNQGNKSLILPALRGVMGSWIYYSCLVPLKEIADRVHFAHEIHNSENLSQMIQRQLKSSRAGHIADYIRNQQERFFNSLVVATYGGQPSWNAITNVSSGASGLEVDKLSDDVIASIGFLTFRGDEELFALDGQHRLAGIKKAVTYGLSKNNADEISVIFVAHKTSLKGLERTRRLFTTLNKTAKPVSKGDIIALDEDDTMAICVRRLIENTNYFSGERIAFVASNNMPSKNDVSLTTIGNLYDVLKILFTQADTELRSTSSALTRIRPSDEKLDEYFELSTSYFQNFQRYFEEIDEFFDSKNPTAVVKKYRTTNGGSVIFRPIGLDIFARVIARLSKDMPLRASIKKASLLPRSLTSAPYKGLMWDPNTKTISNAHVVTVREVLLYMLGASKYTDSTLLVRYRKALGDTSASLPKKLI